MTDRYTADSINSDALDQLYARMERAEHLVESFDAIADTWLRDGTSEPTKVAGRYLRRVLDEARPPSGPAATEATEPVRQADADPDDPPVQCWHTEADTPCDWDVCKQPERLAAGDYGTDPREQH
jgi:hypothetical protein